MQYREDDHGVLIAALSGRAAFRLVVLPPLARVSVFGPERTWPYGIRLGRFGPVCVALQS
jgi:hypothetical protein